MIFTNIKPCKRYDAKAVVKPYVLFVKLPFFLPVHT